MLPAIPTPIPMPFAQNGERRAIPETNTTPGSADASWATGFPPVTRINKQAGGKPPYGLDFQGLFHTICEHLFFAQSGNTVPWVGASDGGPGLNYFKGAIVQGSDGEIYMALKPSGPDASNPDGAGTVGPVDPVGDESGHWISLKLLLAGAPNSEVWVTESGVFTAPVAGWYLVLLIGGGGGARLNRVANQSSIVGGTSGQYKTALIYLTAGQQVEVIIGAGGISSINNYYAPRYGGITSFGSLTSADGYALAASNNTTTTPTTETVWASGGGFGSSFDISTAFYGAGGSGEVLANKTGMDGMTATNGKHGAVRLRFWNPAKANGPASAPATFAARRMAASLSAPATVNLYNPETGQGSVWREEDVEAKLAEGLITQEAWQEICAAKAAEDYAEWLANPETEAERFAMLRRARDARLVATDYLVAPDYPLTDEQRAAVTAYRQALRDLPAEAGAPWDGGGELTPWPDAPTVSKVTAQE